MFLGNLFNLALLALGLYLLVTSVQAFLAGNRSTTNIVYIAIGVVLVVYNLGSLKKIFGSA